MILEPNVIRHYNSQASIHIILYYNKFWFTVFHFSYILEYFIFVYYRLRGNSQHAPGDDLDIKTAGGNDGQTTVNTITGGELDIPSKFVILTGTPVLGKYWLYPANPSHSIQSFTIIVWQCTSLYYKRSTWILTVKVCLYPRISWENPKHG